MVYSIIPSLRRMADEGWANEHDGEIDAPGGRLALITIHQYPTLGTGEAGEIRAVFSDVPDFVIPDFGYFLLETYGDVSSVSEYASGQQAERAFHAAKIARMRARGEDV